MPLRYTDANMLKYIWEEKGDLSRYVGYEDVRDQLDKEYPILKAALERHKESEQAIETALNLIISESIIDE